MDTFLTLEELKTKAEPYLNTLVLDLFEVVRLVGVEDKEDDFYWVYESLERGTYLSSCVMDWFPMKGLLLQDDYYDLVRIFNLNLNSEVKVI